MKRGSVTSYKVQRIYRDHPGKVQTLARGMTEAEAQAWCSDSNASSSTAWKTEPLKRTKRWGPWFECYTRE